MDESVTPTSYTDKKPKEMNFQEIKNEIKRLGKYHVDTPSLITEFHRKISISFASMVFIIAGIPLGIFTRRGEKTIQFAIALGVIVIYYLLMAASIALSLRGTWSPVFLMYMPNIIIGAAGIILLRKTVEM